MIENSRLDNLFDRLADEQRVAIAVSGGPDSMTLLLLADRWQRSRLADGYAAPELVVLTVDHGLRPEAVDECHFVMEQARRLGHEAQTLSWDGDVPQSRLQEIARARRYQLLASTCHSRGISILLTAHHVEDQAETFLMRLGRGSGLDGLAAIPEESRRYGLRLVRPLLGFTKSELLAVLHEADCEYLVDPSNEDQRFERVRLRQSQEELETLGLSAQKIGLSAKRLGRARRALEETRDRFLEENALFSNYGSVRVDQLAFSDCPEDIALRALARMLRTCGGNLEPPGMAQLENLCVQMRDDFSSNQTLAGCRILSKGDFWLVVREAGRINELEKPVVPGECMFWDNRFIICAGESASRQICAGPLGKPEGLKPLVGEERLRKIPLEALSSLLAFRLNGEIIAVPTLEYWDEPAIRAALSAKFIAVDEGLL